MTVGVLEAVLRIRDEMTATLAWERASGSGGDEREAERLAGDEMVQEVIEHEFEDAQDVRRARSAE